MPLSERQQTIVRLRTANKMPFAKIGELLNLPTRSAQRICEKARKRLKDRSKAFERQEKIYQRNLKKEGYGKCVEVSI